MAETAQADSKLIPPTSGIGTRSISPIPQSIDDRATTSYIRRTLCAHHAISSGPPRSIHDLLPPLTSFNDIDLQLYAIIAVVLKEFVQSWYGKVTPDHGFIDEVLRVIAHCTRSLEERARNVDFEALLCDEIPRLIDDHVTAFRIAHSSDNSNGLEEPPRAIYHSLFPHPSLSPVPDPSDQNSLDEQDANEQAWRQLLVQSTLAVLLPTDDLQNGCLRALIEQILAEIIIGNVLSARLCESWVIWDLITNAIETLHLRRDNGSLKVNSDKEVPKSRRNLDKVSDGKIHTSPKGGIRRLEQFGLVDDPIESESQSMKPVNLRAKRMDHAQVLSTLTSTFWALLHYGFIGILAIRAVALLLLSSTSYQTRMNSQKNNEALPKLSRPILDMTIWKTTANLVELPQRMPWLSGLLSLAQWTAITGPGSVGKVDGKIDRLLSHFIHSRMLNPALIPPILRSARRTLFPSNTFPRGPPNRAPEPAGIVVAKQRCAEAILDVIPPVLRTTYLASRHRDSQLLVVEGWLDVLADPYLNRHLMFSILEVCLVRLLPEIGERGPKALLEKRLGGVDL